MKPISDKSFGLVIAFLLPGFICLWALSYSVPDIAVWLVHAGEKTSSTVGGFLYSTLASLSLGLLLSAFRWVIIDHLLFLFGIRPASVNFAALSDKNKLAAFEAVIENHYRYYQYYSNTFVGILCAGVTFTRSESAFPMAVWIGVAAVELTLFLASWDAFYKYDVRAKAILGTIP